MTSSAPFTAPALALGIGDRRPAVPLPAASAPERSRPLTEQGLLNLIAFTRLLGYVRHFHPSDQAATADWDVLAVDGMRRIERCKGAEQLAQALETFFRPVAPTVQVFPSGTPPKPLQDLAPPAGAVDLKVVSWRHYGIGQVAQPSPYKSERISVVASSIKPAGEGTESDWIFEADLGTGVSRPRPAEALCRRDRDISARGIAGRGRETRALRQRPRHAPRGNRAGLERIPALLFVFRRRRHRLAARVGDGVEQRGDRCG